jgi:hypothetical protein
VENGSAVVRSYNVSGAGSPTLTASRNLGFLGGGSIAGIALDNGQLVVAGSTHNTALAAGTTTAAGGAGSNAFVAALNPNLAPSGSDSVAYYQSNGGTTATAVSVANGDVYIAGQTGPTLTDANVNTSASSSGPQPVTTGQAGYIAQVDPVTGQVGFSTSLSGEAGIAAPTSISVATGAASVLDRLGLPSGTINQTPPSNLLASATSLQPGDSFYIQGIAGQPPTKVTIQTGDTLQSLASRIAQASDFRLTAAVTSSTTQETLTLTATDPNNSVQILAGPTGENALPALGLTPGLVQPKPPSTSSSSSTTPPQTTFGLGLSSSINLSTAAQATQAGGELQYAISQVQAAYQALVAANTPKSAQAAVSNAPVPSYLSAQLANYQAGLARLTGS